MQSVELTDPIRTNAHRAYQVIRERIIRCEAAPMQKLKIANLAVELGVSLGAVREALSRLTTEHLVEARDQMGFRVAAISLEDLEDLTQTRVEIESLALNKSIAQGGDSWRAQLEHAHTVLLSLHGQPVSSQSAVQHAMFHTALVVACDSPALLRIRAGLWEQSERYRYLAARGQKKSRDVKAEHAALVRAALNGDARIATMEMTRHIRLTADLVRAALVEQQAWSPPQKGSTASLD